MMNQENQITTQTLLYGFIAENAHSNRFSVMVNRLFKDNGINAMVIPMNIRPDDVTFTLSQMGNSKLNGALIATEYQEEALSLVDHASRLAHESGYCDFIRIVEGKLWGELITPSALEKFSDTFREDIALNAMTHYFYDLITGETSNDKK